MSAPEPSIQLHEHELRFWQGCYVAALEGGIANAHIAADNAVLEQRKRTVELLVRREQENAERERCLNRMGIDEQEKKGWSA